MSQVKLYSSKNNIVNYSYADYQIRINSLLGGRHENKRMLRVKNPPSKSFDLRSCRKVQNWRIMKSISIKGPYYCSLEIKNFYGIKLCRSNESYGDMSWNIDEALKCIMNIPKISLKKK
ncbi:hypothetical protein RF11_15937 [Thelohanellus kitauei]|uniref:Uncharacterized protein n=1 Tax=Thelohanellus kitauei TaxID=669202 RepID=A0A0C2JBA0_THEKT|nr:hypothetical protein RF11_15937 [Thelohanellus kitauei]